MPTSQSGVRRLASSLSFCPRTIPEASRIPSSWALLSSSSPVLLSSGCAGSKSLQREVPLTGFLNHHTLNNVAVAVVVLLSLATVYRSTKRWKGAPLNALDRPLMGLVGVGVVVLRLFLFSGH